MDHRKSFIKIFAPKRKLDTTSGFNHGQEKSTDNVDSEHSKKIKLSDDGRLQISQFVDGAVLQEIQHKEENEEIDEVPNVSSVEVAAISKFSPFRKTFKCDKKFRKPEKEIEIAPLIPQGNFYGLTTNHKQFLFNLRGISKLYDWQEQSLNLTISHKRINFIYSAPTSGGKTLVSEILMLREVLLRKKNVIFLLPYVSIVQEKVHEMMPLAVEFDFLIEEYCAGKGSIPPVKRRKKNSIFICTTEKGHILLDSLIEAGRISELSLIVVDELHMLGDSHRGYILESLLTKIIYLETVPIQIVGMSATISNINEISSFLNAEKFVYNFRPIELKEYLKTGTSLYKIDTKTNDPAKILKKVRKVIGTSYTPEMIRKDPDHIGYFVYKAAMESSCLVFCATKANCENVALLISESVSRELKTKRVDEKKKLINSIKNDLNGNICPILAKTIPYGVAYHHSGLTTDERKHIEEAFHHGILTVICCTSTLAAGVNLPASRVIIRAPYVGQNFISLGQYKQMIGRAGRTGKSEKGDSILFCDKKDFHKIANMFSSKLDDTISAFLKDITHFRTLLLNLLGTNLCKNFDELHDYSKCMLSRVQQEKFSMNMKKIFIETLKELLNEGLVIQKFQSTKSKTSPVLTYNLNGTETEVFAKDYLLVSKLAKAAVNSGMSLDEAIKVESDLRKAHENLVLSQCLHLLFVVAPKEAADAINLDYKIYSDHLLKLDSSLMMTANVIGINEKVAIKMIRNPNFQESYVYMLKRFYIAMILYELWNGGDLFKVSKKYKVNRGIVHKLMYLASSQAYSIFKFCEVFEEFWIFKEIMEQFSKRLAYCCSTELLPLMELPGVKIARANMMYKAGLKTIQDVAALTPQDLIDAIKNVNRKQAEQMIRAAKNTLAEQIDTLKVQVYEMEKAVKESIEIKL